MSASATIACPRCAELTRQRCRAVTCAKHVTAEQRARVERAAQTTAPVRPVSPLEMLLSDEVARVCRWPDQGLALLALTDAARERGVTVSCDAGRSQLTYADLRRMLEEARHRREPPPPRRGLWDEYPGLCDLWDVDLGDPGFLATFLEHQLCELNLRRDGAVDLATLRGTFDITGDGFVGFVTAESTRIFGHAPSADAIERLRLLLQASVRGSR